MDLSTSILDPDSPDLVHDSSRLSVSKISKSRTFHDFDADTFARGKISSSSIANFKHGILTFVCGRVGRRLFGCLVFMYLLLTLTGICMDLGVYCMNARIGTMDMKHLTQLKKPTQVRHHMDKHSDRLWKHGERHIGILSPEEAEKERPHIVDGHAYEEELEHHMSNLLQVPRAMLRGAKAAQVMVCDAPMSGTGAMFAEQLSLGCLVISVLQFVEHLSRMYALGPTLFFSFSSLAIDFFFSVTGLCGDLAISIFLLPWAVENVKMQKPSARVVFALFALRLWRCTMLWRMIRSIRGDFSAGSELLWAFKGMEAIHSKFGGMENADVTKVTVIKCAAHDADDYRSRRNQMREIHGSSCEQKLLFYGIEDGCIGKETPEDTVRKPLARSRVKTIHEQKLVYGAERPVYIDSCYAYASAGEGLERRMILLKAIIANPDIVNIDEEDTEQPATLVKSSTGHVAVSTLGMKSDTPKDTHSDCICTSEEIVPEHYQFKKLQEQLQEEDNEGRFLNIVQSDERDVRSRLFGFHERGMLVPVAIIHYTNPDAEDETHALKFIGSRGWPDFCRPHRNLTSEQRSALETLYMVIDRRDLQGLEPALERCRELQLRHGMREVMNHLKQESENAGISLEYLLAEAPVESLSGQMVTPFGELARTMTGMPDPTFRDLKTPFFMNTDTAVGGGLLCPRDLQPGCSFIDSVAKKYRKKANHFMSWVWGYELSIVQGAMKRYLTANNESVQEDQVFLYVCFFCNNQWRILVQKTSSGSDNLSTIFEARLMQIGKVVAVMDSWENPVYTKRIWTIYEQYVATKIGIPVHFTLPELPSASMFKRIERGRSGIQYVVNTISDVDAEKAQASHPEDEKTVKDLIRGCVGFPTVNATVQKRIVQWLSEEFKGSIATMVTDASSEKRKVVEEVD